MTGERAFRVIHLALVSGVVIIGIVFTILTQHHSPPGPDLTLPLRIAAFAELGLLIVASVAVRRALAPFRPGTERDAWWTMYGPRVLVLWALAEGTALLGAVFWYLSGDFLVFAGLMGVGLATLVWSSPGRFAE